MRGINKVILVGTLGGDPEAKYFADNGVASNFRIATSESWVDKNTGERIEQTEWHRITATGQKAEICNHYLRKGSKVYIEGSLRTRSWIDQNTGQEKFITEIRLEKIEMLSSPQEVDNQPQRESSYNYNNNNAPSNNQSYRNNNNQYSGNQNKGKKWNSNQPQNNNYQNRQGNNNQQNYNQNSYHNNQNSHNNHNQNNNNQNRYNNNQSRYPNDYEHNNGGYREQNQYRNNKWNK